MAFAESWVWTLWCRELHEGRAEAAREVVNQLIASQATADEHTTRILHDSYLNLITISSWRLQPPLLSTRHMTMMMRTAVLNINGWSAPGPGCNEADCSFGSCRSMLRFRKATRYISPGTTGCGYTASPTTPMTSSNRLSSLASIGQSCHP